MHPVFVKVKSPREPYAAHSPCVDDEHAMEGIICKQGVPVNDAGHSRQWLLRREPTVLPPACGGPCVLGCKIHRQT
jgi:hypothetical protein